MSRHPMRLGTLPLTGLLLATPGAAIVGTIAVYAVSQAAESSVVAVVLPDLESMHPSVREQIREAHRALLALEPEDRSTAYGQLGTLLLAGEYLVEAETCFRNAQRLAPDVFRWSYYLGHVYKTTGRLTQAVEQFEQVLRLRPGDLPTLVWLGQVLIDLGQPEAAELLLADADGRHPDTQSVLFQLGRAAGAMGNHEEAVSRLEAALELNPGATMVHYPLAMAYRGLGDLERAEAHLGRSGRAVGAGVAVTVPDPLMADVNTALRSPQAFWDLGLYAGSLGNWPEAVRQFQSAVELAPDVSALRLNLALALNRVGEARFALEQLEEAVRLEPELALAHLEMGALFERSGSDPEAIDYFTLATTHAPGLVEAHLRLADALRRTGQVNASLASYGQVLKLDPGRAEARFGEVMALVRLMRHRDAVTRLREALEHHPGEQAFRQALSRLLAASPDPMVRDGAEALALVQPLTADGATTAVAETIAMAFAERGEFLEAVDWQRAAMSGAAGAGHPAVAQQMAANLALYRTGQPCRTPWRDDAPEHRPGPIVEAGLLDPGP